VSLTVIGVTFSLINLAVFLFLRKKITDMNQGIQQDQGKEYGTAMNGLMMIETIKANGGEADFFAKWAGYRAKVLAATQTRDLWSLTSIVLPVFFGGINTALIMTLGGFSIMDGVMTAGIFLAFQNLMGKFQEPVNNLVGLGNTLQTTEMQMKRLDDVRRYAIDSLNYPEDRQPAKAGEKPAKTRLTGELELVDVSFGYSPLEPPLLDNFSLHLEPGYWVAIVGGSGSGKSTLAKIVTGLYEEWSGEVRFDGIKRRDLSRQAIVSSLASVDQDIFQITGSVRENISLFDSSLGRADIMQAAKDACIHDVINSKPGAYDYMLTEGGVNLSGGQRQRLEIARALIMSPSILIMDEATSALDPIVEKQIIDNIKRRGCTCIIVAHRLSAIRDCDEIIVLDKGVVIERGTHEELYAMGGAYTGLVTNE
jgi:ABC-type bacteriocin/lantibiotic exporter with double-glycine peptidase domain